MIALSKEILDQGRLKRKLAQEGLAKQGPMSLEEARDQVRRSMAAPLYQPSKNKIAEK